MKIYWELFTEIVMGLEFVAGKEILALDFNLEEVI